MHVPIFLATLVIGFAAVDRANAAPLFGCEKVQPERESEKFKRLCDAVTAVAADLDKKNASEAIRKSQQGLASFPAQSDLFRHLEFQARLNSEAPKKALQPLRNVTDPALQKAMRAQWEMFWGQQKTLPPQQTQWSKQHLKKNPQLVGQYLLHAHKDLSKSETKRLCRHLLARWPHLPTVQLVAQKDICAQVTLSVKQKLMQIEHLLKASFPLQAAEKTSALLRTNSKLTEAQRKKLNLMAVETQIRGGKWDEGLAVAKGLVTAHPKSGAYWGKYAWALAKTGQLAEAIEKRKQQELQAETAKEREEGCFFAGFGLYELNAYKKANQHWRRCASEYPKGQWANALTWYIPFTHLLNRDPKAAVAYWEHRKTQRAKHQNRKRYFMAVAHSELKQSAQAAKIFTRLAETTPMDYYGLLARARLNLPPIQGTLHAHDALEQEANKVFSLLTDAQRLWLILGQFELFRQSITGQQIKQNRAAFYGLYQRLGDHHRPWRRAGKITPRQKNSGNAIRYSPSWRATYAMPHEPLVREASAASGVDVEMIYGIMRTESGFLRSAISPVGALGLMQLMPYTAAFVAQTLNTDLPPRHELLAPQGSVWLGAHFLGTLKKTFKEDFLVAAAYNGSPKAVHQWIESFGRLPTDYFVERIPYRETRQYVKKVMTTKAMYAGLNGKPVILEFPERLPKVTGAFPSIETTDTVLK